MINVYENARDRVKLRLGDLSARWSDDDINDVTHWADCAIREATEFDIETQSIDLTDGENYYDLDDSVVAVLRVQCAIDGTNIDHTLVPKMIHEIDAIQSNWQTTTGSYPSCYSLISTPGMDDSVSQILIWPTVATATAEALKVDYVYACPVDTGDEWEHADTGAHAPRDVIENLHVPYTLAVLYGTIDPAQAATYLREYDTNLRKLRGRLLRRYTYGLDTKRGAY